MDRTYRVAGMSCEGCVTSLTKAVRKRAPELDFRVQLQPGAIVVHGDHAPELIAQAIAAAGFAMEGSA
jgi:copper chaperone CopZ